MGGSKFAKVFFSGYADQKQRNSRSQCVLWLEEIILIWCFYFTWLKSRTWTWASCLSLEHPKYQRITLFRMGFVHHLSEMQREKEIETVPSTNTWSRALSPAQLVYGLVRKCWRTLSPFSTFCDLCSREQDEMLMQLWIFTIVLNVGEWSFQIGWGGYDFFFILLFCCRHVIPPEMTGKVSCLFWEAGKHSSCVSGISSH